MKDIIISVVADIQQEWGISHPLPDLAREAYKAWDEYRSLFTKTGMYDLMSSMTMTDLHTTKVKGCYRLNETTRGQTHSPFHP